MFFRNVLEQIERPCAGPSILNVDNTGALALVERAIINRGSQHIGVRFFYLRQCQERSDIKSQYVVSNKNIADILTKPLGRQPLEALCALLFADA